MALGTYARFKLFWGAIDVEKSDENAYTAAQTKPMGENANPPGIGVRRAQLVFDRSTMTPAEDVITTHMDFQNFTNGEPDDSWTDQDFVLLEQSISSHLGGLVGMWNNKINFNQIRWYRIGPGIAPPNPPVRVTATSHAGSGQIQLPPQTAVSVTLRTAVRRCWGRMYLPCSTGSWVHSDGRIDDIAVQSVAGSIHAIMQEASAADFLPIVYSKTRSKAFSIEAVQVDDLFDVIRSRRYDRALNKHVYDAG